MSRNRTLAPPELARASSTLTRQNTPASKVYDSVVTWCTNNTDMDPYIDMEFTSPVLITTMISSGSTIIQTSFNGLIRLGVYYVTNFTLEHSPPDNSSVLSYYRPIDESAEIGRKLVSEMSKINKFYNLPCLSCYYFKL